MAALQLLLGERVAAGLRRERVFRDRLNPLDKYDDTDMYERYRFTRRGVMNLIDLMAPRLEHATKRSHAIDGRIQVFVALKFFATGSVHHSTGDVFGVSKASCSRIIPRVLRLLVRMKDRVIHFPNTPQEVATAQGDFYAVGGFPRVVSAVDCTHVKLFGSDIGENEHAYVNRKREKSINVQLMCDTNYKITNIVARWPGSTHDSRILGNSNIGQHFDAGNMNGIVIADSGYPLKSWLMTPILDPQSAAERAYNRAHRTTRVYIEQVNGQLKNKFPCLQIGLRIRPRLACKTAVACAVLFNKCKEWNEPILDEEVFPPPPAPDNGDIHDGGLAVRAQIVHDFFN